MDPANARLDPVDRFVGFIFRRGCDFPAMPYGKPKAALRPVSRVVAEARPLAALPVEPRLDAQIAPSRLAPVHRP